MDFKEYQEFAKENWQPGCNLVVFALGLGGETGEVLDIIKKAFRDCESVKSKEAHLREEIGDVLWYVANLCTALGYDLEDIAKENKIKIDKRYGEKKQ